MPGLIAVAAVAAMIGLQLVLPIYLGVSGGSFFWLIPAAAVLAAIGTSRGTPSPAGPRLVWGFLGSLVVLAVIFFLARWLS